VLVNGNNGNQRSETGEPAEPGYSSRPWQGPGIDGKGCGSSQKKRHLELIQKEMQHSGAFKFLV